MKCDRILKILKFLGRKIRRADIECVRRMREKSPYAYNGTFANAHEARPGRYGEPHRRPYLLATCAAQKIQKIYRERRFKIYKIFSEQHVNFSRRLKEA